MAGQPSDFDPSATNELYDTLSDAWELNRDFAEMHLHVLRDGTYLDEFGGGGEQGGKSTEAGAQWAWRKNQSFAIDHCADLINLRVDNLFRTPPARKYDGSPYAEFIDSFLADVDGGGTDMTSFMRKALKAYYINGVDLVVDKDRPDDGIEVTNLAQEQQLGLRPYIHQFGPLDRMDWSVDHAGGYLWVRYYLGPAPSLDETDDTGDADVYLTMTRDEWRLYETTTTHDNEGKPRTSVTVETGPLGLGQCPVVPFYFKESSRSDYPKVPLSLLTRIAPVSRYLMNLVSQIQIDIYRNIAFLVATGVEPGQVPSEISPMGCWALPAGATLADVSGNVGHIQVKMDLATVLMQAILRIGKLTGGAGDMQARAASGVQVAVERTDLDNEMRMTATQAEQVERDLVWLAVCRYTGELVDKADIGYSVTYNKKYVLQGVTELIDQAKKFVDLGHTTELPTMMKLMLRKILDAVASEDDTAYEEAMKEIEAAGFDSMGLTLPDMTEKIKEPVVEPGDEGPPAKNTDEGPVLE